MSYDDPFDDLPDDNVVEVPAAVEPVVQVDASLEGTELSLTFKGLGGYGDRWVVVRAPDPESGLRVVKSPAFKELLDYTRKIAEYDAAAHRSAAPAPQQQVNQPNPSRAPQAAQEAPNGEKRFCEHGEMVFKSGVSKAGNAYKLFSCTAPREQQCKAQYLK